MNVAPSEPHWMIRALHVAVLCNLAIAQPLLAVLVNSPEFFIAHRAAPLDMLLLVAVVCVVRPAALAALVAATHLAGARVGRFVHAATLSWLAGLIALVALQRLAGLPLPVLLAAATATAVLSAVAYTRLPAARTFVTFLSPALLLVPAAFLAQPAMSKLVWPRVGEVRAASGPDVDVPVVLVVFDELPLVSLLDEQFQIDATEYPNFARLAREGRWFRNATTVSHNTFYGIPAILTGRYPERDRFPIASDHPQSLFALLAASHALHVFEAGTRVCPASLCPEGEPSSGFRRRIEFFNDALIVYLHVLAPSPFDRALPSVDEGWNDFGGNPDPARNDRPTVDDVNTRMVEAARSDRLAVFESFLGRIDDATPPGLYYLHTMLTHVPWVYLPSGRPHGLADHPGRLAGERWADDEFLVAQSYQRQLLQVGFADRLLGRLLDRLAASGLYDRALIIVTSDHGGTFRAGDRRRHLSPTTLPEVVPVPLLVRFPGEARGGISDAPVETIDILPTVADVLGVPPPAGVDGRSLRDPLHGRDRRAFGDGPEVFAVAASTRELMAEPLARKLALSGVRDAREQARARAILGRAVGELHVEGPDSLVAQVSRWVDVTPDAAVLEVGVRGLIHAGADVAAPPTERDLAIAVNGVVRAITRTFAAGRYLRFTAMLPEDALHPGRNLVEVFALQSSGEGRVTLHPFSRERSSVQGLTSGHGAQGIRDRSVPE